MNITRLQRQQKNLDRISVYVDGVYSFSLTDQQLLDEKIVVGLEVDEVHLESLKKISAEGKSKQRFFEWLLLRPRSKREAFLYAKKKSIEPDVASAWIAAFEAKGILNDASFAEWFVNQSSRKKKSKRELTAELAAKGVSTNTISEVLHAYADDSVAIRTLVAKLRNRPNYHDRDKLTAYLLRKGYGYDLIKTVLDEEQ